MAKMTEEIGRVAIRAYQTSNEAESHFDLMVGVNTEPAIPGGKLVEEVLARDIVVTEQVNTDVRHDTTKTVVASKMVSYDQVEKAAKGRIAPSKGLSTVAPLAGPAAGMDKVDYLKNMHDQLDNAVQGDRASGAATMNELHAADKKLFLGVGCAIILGFIGAATAIVYVLMH